jgi:competence protein ComEC
MTSLIAGTATGLYAAWHFQRVAPLGLVANLLAMPVVSVAVMPTAVAGTVLAPLGLDGPFFTVMGWGLSWVIAVAEWVAARSPLDGVGLIPPSAVVVLSVALVILTVATTWLRVAAVPLLAAGIALIAMRELPDALLDEDGRLVAMRMTEGRLAVNRTRPSSFTMENWGRALAAEKTVRPAKEVLAEGGEQLFSCAGDLCLARHASGAVIATAPNAEAAAPACAIAALIVIDDATAHNPCGRDDAARIITKRDLARRGSAAVRFAGDGEMQVVFAIGDGERPWHYQRRFSRAARGLPPYQRKKKDGRAADMPVESKSAAPPAATISPDDAVTSSPAAHATAQVRAAGEPTPLPIDQ